MGALIGVTAFRSVTGRHRRTGLSGPRGPRLYRRLCATRLGRYREASAAPVSPRNLLQPGLRRRRGGGGNIGRRGRRGGRQCGIQNRSICGRFNRHRFRATLELSQCRIRDKEANDEEQRRNAEEVSTGSKLVPFKGKHCRGRRAINEVVKVLEGQESSLWRRRPEGWFQ